MRRLRVLLVEDNVVNQMVMQEMLSELDVDVIVVGDGHAAVNESCALGDRPDLVLMDGELPGVDGYEATRQIRAWEDEYAQPAMRIIALTAHLLDDELQETLNAGMNAYLSKPVSLARLRQTLEETAALLGIVYPVQG